LDKNKAIAALKKFISLEGKEKTIKFFGGEPLLEFRLFKALVKKARVYENKFKKSITLTVSTNGLLLNKDISDFLSKNKISAVVNIVAFKDNVSNWEERVKNIVRIPGVMLNYLIFPNSVSKLSSDFKKLVNLGFKNFNFLPVYYVAWKNGELSALSEGLNNVLMMYLQRPHDICINNLKVDNAIPLFTSSFALDCDGKVYLSDIILVSRSSKKINKIVSNDFLVKPDFNLKNFADNLMSGSEFSKSRKADKVLSDFVVRAKGLKKSQKRADIKIGFECNNKCKFCAQGSKRQSCGNKDIKEIKNELLNASLSCKEVVFTGGEPTIHKNLIELIKYAKNIGFKHIQIQTNGRMFAYKKFVEEIVGAGANEFAIAVHGHISSLHDYLTSADGSFFQSIKGIANLKESGQRVISNTVITKSNYSFLPQIAKLLIGLGVDQYQFAFVHPVGRAADNFYSLVPRMLMLEPFVKRGLELGIDSGVNVMTEAIPYCFMKGYEKYVAEKIIPETKVYDFGNIISDYTLYRRKEGKLKGPQCHLCSFFSLCEGPWREYPQHYGWQEFNPVLKK